MIAEAKRQGRKPRVHGNGFLQLDLDDVRRFHIWGHPLIPAQKTPTPIHDHTFTFESEVIVGVMVNDLFRYEVTSPNRFTHRVYRAQVREGEDTMLVAENAWDSWGELKFLGRHELLPGASYTLTPEAIHESSVKGLTLTVITKHGKTLSQGGSSPRVFVPKGVEPDNSFHRTTAMSPSAMDQVFQEAYRAMGFV